jgi:hypothetical protein
LGTNELCDRAADPCGIVRGPVRNCPGTRAELSGDPCGIVRGPVRDCPPCLTLILLLVSEREMIVPTLPHRADVWDLDQLRLPAERVGSLETRRRPPRHRPGDPFIKGPVPHAWIASACRLPGSGLRVAMASRFLCCRFRSENRWGLDAIADGLRITSRSARRGINSAELAGLLAVEREPGCKLVVSILECPKSEAGPERRPLHGPIPWSWWLPASRLSGRSLQVASVCWLLAGWSRSADFEMALDGWAEFGLSRFSARRGLDTLECAGLIHVVRRPGRTPIVTLSENSGTRA